MKKRLLSILLSLCLVLTLVPATVFAADTTVEGCDEHEASVEEPEPEQTTVEQVQALINALPDANTITEENRADVEAQLTAIDEAKLPLGDEEQGTLDFTKYNDAIAALNVLDGIGGAEVPDTLATAGILDVGNRTFEGVTTTTKYEFGSGTATFDPSTSTLTLNNATITKNSRDDGDTAAIYSEISGLKIVLKGENKITLSNTSSTNTVLGMYLTYGATISGDTGSKLIIEYTGTNNISKNNRGIYSLAGLKISGTSVTIEDKTTNADAKGWMIGIWTRNGNLNLDNVKYTATGVLCAIETSKEASTDTGANCTLNNVTFNVNCTPPKNFNASDPTTMAIGVHICTGNNNTITGCSGSITAQFPLYIDAATELKNSNNLSLTTDNYYAANLNDDTTISGGTLNLKATGTDSSKDNGGFYLKNSTKLVFDNSTNVTVNGGKAGIAAGDTSSVEIKSGTVNTTAAAGVALKTSDSKFTLTGGKLNMNPRSGVDSVGIQSYGTITVTGGNLTTTGMKNAILNVGGKTVSISGGTHTLGVAAGGTGYKDQASGNLNISNNANVTFTGGNYNIDLNGKLNLSGGTLNAGGAANVGIALNSNSAANLTGGTLNVNDAQYGIMMNGGGELKFAGTNVKSVGSKAGWATTSDSLRYTVTGGKVVLQGGERAASGMYSSSLPEGYGVYAGSDEGNASKVNNPSDATFTGNKYVCIQPAASYTLTLESVYYNEVGLELPSGIEPTTHTHEEGSTISYTAADPINGFHFDHWELNGTNVGSNKTYTGTMPSGNATLSTVYAACTSVNTAACGEKPVCDTCGKEFGVTKMHNFQEVVDEKYEITAPTCETDGTYYKSCSSCGASAEGFGYTFTVPATGHTGGTATCTKKAECSVCGKEYGDIKSHDYTEKAETEAACVSAPTCTYYGTYYYSCSMCHGVEGDVNHTFTGTTLDMNNHVGCKQLQVLVKSYGGSAKMTLQVIKIGETEPTAETTINNASNNVIWTFYHLEKNTTYTLRVMKENHVTREYTVTFGNYSLTQETEICLIGDVNGDGEVDAIDWNMMYDHINETDKLSDYSFACGDVNGDGDVNAIDWNKMYDHINETKPLW